MTMKRSFLSIVLGVCVVIYLTAITYGALSDPEFDTALQRMHQEWLTRYENQSEFHPEDFLTREQAAKFLWIFAALDGKETWVIKTSACVFSDEELIDPTLKEWVIYVCEHGLMKWRTGGFHPSFTMTKAEVLTVLVRMEKGQLDESATPWRTAYVEHAQNTGLTKETQTDRFEQPVTRYEIALLLRRAFLWEWPTENAVDPYLQEQSDFLQLLKELGVVAK